MQYAYRGELSFKLFFIGRDQKMKAICNAADSYNLQITVQERRHKLSSVYSVTVKGDRGLMCYFKNFISTRYHLEMVIPSQENVWRTYYR